MARGNPRHGRGAPDDQAGSDDAIGSAQQTGPREVVSLRTWPDDRAFLQALRDGDVNAQRELFDRHHRRITQLLVRVLGCDDEVEDLAQEAFLGVLKGLPTFRGDAQMLSGWITKIAVYTARGAIRRRRRMRLFRARTDGQPVEGKQPANQETSQLLKHAYRAIEQLPVDERLAFTLRFIDGMELQDVASACGVSLATVKRLLQRSRRRFTSIAARDPWLAERLPSKLAP